jgi:hypothetical protein
LGSWTLQEFALTPRSLLYTSQEFVWECHTSKHCELGAHNVQDDDLETQRNYMKRFFSTHKNLELLFSRLPMRYLNPSYRWYTLINDYSRRDLTLRKDVFPAISGLAREHERQTRLSYITGIWKENIHQGLLWVTADTAIRATEAYHAPSWS